MSSILSFAARPRPASQPHRPRLDLSIVVSTYERPRHLRHCLESIAAQEDVAERIEVVVCDDGSRDATPAMVAAFSQKVPFRVAFTTHRHDGFRLSQSRNEGVCLHAVHPEGEPLEEWLRGELQRQAAGRVAGPRVVPEPA